MNTQEDLTLKQDSFIGPVQPYQGPIEPAPIEKTSPPPPIPTTNKTTTVSSTPISVTSLQNPEQPVKFEQPALTPVYPVTDLNTDIPELQATSQETKASDLTSRLMSLNESLVGESAYRTSEENKAGLPGLMKTRTELSSRLNTLKNEALQIPLQLQQEAIGRGITAGGLQPLQTAALRNNAIQALSISSLLEASKGNIELANDMVDRAVKQKYDPIKEEITAKKANLELILDDPETSRQDKNRAQAQKDKLDERDRAIKKAEDTFKEISTIATTASSYGADSRTLQKIMDAKSAAEAMMYASQAGFARDPFEKAKFEADLAQSKAQTALINANIRKVNEEIRQSGIPTTITTPGANNFSGALGVILGSTKFTKDQKAAVINAINNGSDPVAVIKNQAKDIMGQTEATKVSNYEIARDQLTDIQSALQAYYAAGGKTNILSGKWEGVVNKLGTVNDPKLVDLTVQIQSALQIYRNAVSGTAYSVQEGQDIASIFPGINNTQGLNMARLDGRLKAFESTIDGAYRSALGDSYNEIKGAESEVLSGSYNGIDIPSADGSTGSTTKTFSFGGIPITI